MILISLCLIPGPSIHNNLQAYRSRHLSHLLLHLGAGNILLFFSFLRLVAELVWPSFMLLLYEKIFIHVAFV